MKSLTKILAVIFSFLLALPAHADFVSGGGSSGGGASLADSNTHGIVFYNGAAIDTDTYFLYNGSQALFNVADSWGGLHVKGRSGGEASIALQPDTVSDGSVGQWILATNGSNMQNAADFGLYCVGISAPIFTGQTGTGYIGVNKTNPAYQLDVGGTFHASDNVVLGGTNNSVGTITSGTWNGTPITGSYIQSGVALPGAPTSTTPSSSDNSTKLATTAFVNSWAGSTSLVTLGTVTTGVWHATPILNAYLASMAANTVKGSIAGGSPADLTATQLTAIPNQATDTLQGMLPALGDGQIAIGKTASTVQVVTPTGDVTIDHSGNTAIKSSVGLTGNPTTPNQTSSDSSTRIANTAFVHSLTTLPGFGGDGSGGVIDISTNTTDSITRSDESSTFKVDSSVTLTVVAGSHVNCNAGTASDFDIEGTLAVGPGAPGGQGGGSNYDNGQPGAGLAGGQIFQHRTNGAGSGGSNGGQGGYGVTGGGTVFALPPLNFPSRTGGSGGAGGCRAGGAAGGADESGGAGAGFFAGYAVGTILINGTLEANGVAGVSDNANTSPEAAGAGGTGGTLDMESRKAIINNGLIEALGGDGGSVHGFSANNYGGPPGGGGWVVEKCPSGMFSGSGTYSTAGGNIVAGPGGAAYYAPGAATAGQHWQLSGTPNLPGVVARARSQEILLYMNLCHAGFSGGKSLRSMASLISGGDLIKTAKFMDFNSDGTASCLNVGDSVEVPAA